MRLITTLIIAAWPAVAAAQSGYLQAPPLNQKACYRVDRDAQRTASIVRGGRAGTRITRQITMPDGKKGYEAVMTAVYQVMLMGDQTTTISLRVPEEYFERAFMPRLRARGTFETFDFKMQHLGIQTVRTLDGTTFVDADYVRIYDIDTSRSPELAESLRSLARAQAAAQGLEVDEKKADVRNVELKAHIKEGVPALGAGRIDLKGESLGISIRAGIDYTTSASSCAP